MPAAAGLSLRTDYARTLHEWRGRFVAARADVLGLGFDEVFVRLWELYLATSEAGFRSGAIDVTQWTLVRELDHGPVASPPLASARPSFLQSDRVLARAAQPLVRFLHIEAAGGIVLVAATVVALVWANSPWRRRYESLWHTVVRVEVGSYRSTRTSATWSTTC